MKWTKVKSGFYRTEDGRYSVMRIERGHWRGHWMLYEGINEMTDEEGYCITYSTKAAAVRRIEQEDKL